MKRYNLNIRRNIFLVLLIITGVFGCEKNDAYILEEQSVVTPPVVSTTELDKWITKEFTDTYNIAIEYKRKPFDTQNSAPSLTLPQSEQVKKVLVAIKKLWIENFELLGGKGFIKKYAPREIRLYGSPNRNRLGVEIISASHGGAIMSVYRVNNFDPQNEKSVMRLMRMVMHFYAKSLLEYRPADLQKFAALNYRAYENWDTTGSETKGDFEDATAGAVGLGFFSRAAESNPLDDFAETVSVLLCRPPVEINNYIENIRPDLRDKALPVLQKKIEFVDTYFSENFGINRKIDASRFISRAIKNYPNTILENMSDENTNQ